MKPTQPRTTNASQTTPEKGTALSQPATPPGAPPEQIRGTRDLHRYGVGGHVYKQQLSAFATHEKIESSCMKYTADMIDRLGCRDPLEEMLAVQALWTHARLGASHSWRTTKPRRTT